ncbi:hypothetical protein HDU82_001626 [Entophlyctis luteolus]|nr:hypothetical protein HDU82_001626 [Entophlyctis luteolus]
MLESLGISSPAATGGAVAIQWVLKDQFGEIGKLMFINRFAKSLDSHPKTWKFVGEIASLSGALMQLCTILNPSPAWFLTFASFGYAMRSIHFSIYNSTHMTFTRNFALQGNVGDIVAKDDSQQTIAHLLGLLTGITLLTVNHSPIFLFSCFFLIAPAHYHATIAFLNATRFEVLHATNLRILAREYVAAGEAQAKGVLSFDEVSAKGETVWFGESLRATWSGAKISVVGGTVDAVFDTAQALADSWRVLKDQNYLIGYRTATDSFGITFHQDATSSDVIKSIIHVTKLHKEMKSRNSADAANSSNFSELLQSTLEWTVSEYPRFAVDLEAKGWLTDAVFWGDEGNRSTWDRSRPTD